MNFISRNKLIILILAITLLKGVVWSYATPLFQAPDEQVHYATAQHYAEPAGYTPKSYDFLIDKTTLFNIGTQNLSPELRNFLEKTDFDEVRFHKEEIQKFATGSGTGKYERDIRDSNLPRFVESYPAWTVNYPPLFYQKAAFIENLFGGSSIIERFFLLRLMAVFLTVVFVLFSYLTFRELSLSKTASALLAGALSFQPMLTFIGSSFNVDAMLIASFGIFLLGAVRIIKTGPSWVNLILVVAGIAIGVLSKPSGYFLLVASIFLAVIYLIANWNKIIKDSLKNKTIIFSSAIMGLILFTIGTFFIYQEIKTKFFPGSQSLTLIPAYVTHQLEYPIFLGHSWYYWGNFGWLDTPISRYYAYAIWLILALGGVGMVAYLIQKTLSWKSLDVKERILFYQIIFLALIYIGFAFSIHAVNFQQVNPNNVADETNSIAIQGRYFFPVMGAKFFLVALGLSHLLQKIKQEKVFLALFLAMVALNIIGLFIYVIPRFYLDDATSMFSWELINRMSQYKPVWLKEWRIIGTFIAYLAILGVFIKKAIKE